MSTTVNTFKEITQDQIQAWKSECGENNIFHAQVSSKPSDIGEEEDETDLSDKEPITADFVLKRPTRTVLDVVATYGSKKDIVNANRTLIKNCVLGGDMDALNNDGGIYQEVLKKISQLVESKKATLKKL